MANFGRGWGDGYGSQTSDTVEAYCDREARADGDWDWLDRSPRQNRLLAERSLPGGQYVDDEGRR